MPLPRRRRYILLLVVLALIVWSWRPPTRVGGTPPFYASDLPGVALARAAAESIFVLRGTTMDSMYLGEQRTLVVVLPTGAHMKPMWFEGNSCVGGERAWRPAQALALELYQRYARQFDIAAIEVHFPGVAAATGGWGWRASCSRGAGGSRFDRQTLDSLSAKAG